MSIKELLLNKCKEFVNKRLQIIKEVISSNQKSLQSETKSSAGDKHETGRAMLQLEMEKVSQQLSEVQQLKQVLEKINTNKTSSIAHLGSVVTTNEATYYLAISAGVLALENKDYFAVSLSSPIGKLLLGKKEGDIVRFNSKKITIKTIL